MQKLIAYFALLRVSKIEIPLKGATTSNYWLNNSGEFWNQPATCKYRGEEDMLLITFGNMEILPIYPKRARENIGDKVAIRIHADRAGWEGIELFGNIRKSSKDGVNDLSNQIIDGNMS